MGLREGLDAMRPDPSSWALTRRRRNVALMNSPRFYQLALAFGRMLPFAPAS
jgi:hypothetical protein